jgi:hypothetical protein
MLEVIEVKCLFPIFIAQFYDLGILLDSSRGYEKVCVTFFLLLPCKTIELV